MIPEHNHSWSRIFGVFATGVAIAFLVGKAPAALPALRAELGLTLPEAGLFVSLLSLIAGFCGVFIGALSEMAGQRRTALTGLGIAVVAGIGGAMASGTTVLLFMRAIEGIGFFLVSVSLPALIIQLSDDRRRQSAMGLWGAYLPTGAGLILLVGGVVISLAGWRGLWLAISVALMAALLLLAWASAPLQHLPTSKGKRSGLFVRIRETLLTPGAVMLAVCFGCYSGQYLAVTSFVPLILVEKAGWALTSAAAAGAVVILANAVGNVAAGLLLDRGVGRGVLVVVAAIAMAVGAVMVMNDAFPVAVRIFGAVFFSCFGGLIPGALFAGVRLHAPTAAHVSTVNGLMLQAVSIGQFVGPALASYLVSTAGGDWRWSLAYLLPMAVLTAIAGVTLGRIEAR